MKKKRKDGPDTSAGIQYAGLRGISKDCRNAVMRLLQFGDRVTAARILSCSGTHCLLLTVNSGDLVAIKSGFSSGYAGEGPRALSYVIQLLDTHGAELEEFDVDEATIERVDDSALTKADLAGLEAARPVRPTRLWDYVTERHWEQHSEGTLWRAFPPVVPLAVVDPRIADLAVSFWEGPDDRLLTAYRRLEGVVRERIGSDEHGGRLFSDAFLGAKAKLRWDCSDAERQGRGQLFAAAFAAYRNPRAHRELGDHADEQLVEFLLVNHLYRLERSAELRVTDGESAEASAS